MKSLSAFLGSWLCLYLALGVTLAQNSDPDNSYIEKAKAIFDRHNYDSAFLQYQLGRDYYLKTGDSIRYGKCLYGMGYSLHYQGKGKQALPLYIESFDLLSRHLPETDPQISKLNNNIGGAYIDMGNRFKAKSYLEKAYAVDFEQFGLDSISTAITSYNLGLLAIYFGEHQESLTYFMNALPAYMKKYGKNGSRVAQLYTNVGINHYELCDYDLAKEYYNRAINIHLENHGENYWNLAYPYATLGELYELTNEYDKALPYYLKALELTNTEERDLTRLKSILNGILGKFYNKTGEYEKALEYSDRAIQIMKDAYFENHPRIGDFYRIKGNTYKNLKQFENAKVAYDKANEIIKLNYGETHPILAKNIGELADMYLVMGDHQSALQNVEDGIAAITLQFSNKEFDVNPEINSVMDERELLSLVIMRGKTHLDQSKTSNSQKTTFLEKSLEDFTFATTIIDHIRRELLSEGSKLFMQQNAVYVYENAIKICNDLYQITSDKEYLNKAFYFIEKSKGAVLSEALQSANLSEIEGIPTEVLKREKEINRLIKSLELKLADNMNNENDSLQKLITTELFHAKISQDSMAREIKLQYPDYYDLKYNDEVISLEQAQQKVPVNALVISMFEGDSTWFFFTMFKDEYQLNAIQKHTESEVDLEQLFRLLSNSSSDINQLSRQSYLVYQKFIQPILNEYNDIEKIIVVPDGQFSYIPLGALVTDDPVQLPASSRPSYLIEQYAISYANSITLASRKASLKKNEKYVGFAPVYSNTASGLLSDATYRDILTELSGTQEEVQQAGNLFHGKVFLAEEATESKFKSFTGTPAILHLAMHAIIDDQNPMRSKLVFTQGADSLNDGELNAYEIYGIKVQGQLVVLSACNTGIGEMQRGEGVMSLSRAFIYAGCPNIVMSLWRAKDQPTAEIITDFFSNLKDKQDKDEALRQAKIDYLKSADPLKAHPANWATFVLLGNSEPLVLGIELKKLWLIIASIIVISGVIFIYYKRK